MSVLPFFHIYGMVVQMHLALWCGATQVVLPKFDMTQYLELVKRHRATQLFVVPPVALGFAKHPAAQHADFSSVRRVMSGAGPLSQAVQQLCESRFHDGVLTQGYGLTETSPVLSIGYTGEKRYGSCGALVANTALRIVDPVTQRDITACDTQGELWVAGPQVMKAYLTTRDTELSLVPQHGHATEDESNFSISQRYSSGTRCIDTDGHLRVTERLKELIKVKGFQVAPAELEALLVTHPAISDAIVIGVPCNEGTDEAPVAYVVLKEQPPPAAATSSSVSASGAGGSVRLSESDVISFVRDRVEPYKRIQCVRFVPTLPKTPSGKLLRRVCKDEELRKRGGGG